MTSWIDKIMWSKIVILAAFIILVMAHINTNYYATPSKVFRYDIKSYYAYFPALFIEKDIKQTFLDDANYEHRKFFWRVRDEGGNIIIQYSSGMAMMYFPFAFVAHQIAPMLDYEANGFTAPYSFAVVFSNLFFVLLGLWYFRKLLLNYFSELTTSLVMISVLLGTNLFHYATEEPAMPHAYMFSLGAVFLYFVRKWHLKPNVSNTIIIGLLSGLISLTRPNNILILIIFILWDITSFKELKDRLVFFLRKWNLVLLMIVMFFMVWVPQFMYWKIVTGQFLYYSYGPSGGDFYFLKPHFFDQLFSYRKGAIMYSPILFFAFISLIWLVFKNKKFGIPIIVYSIGSYWFLASWWSWWNGGGFGIRMYVDTYPVLFLAYGFLVSEVLKAKKSVKIFSVSLILILSFYGLFRNYQYAHSVIHYDTNTKEMYWKSLFRTKPIPEFWEIANANRPDYFLARCGIYVTKNQIVDKETKFGCVVSELRAIDSDKDRKAQILEEAKISNMSFFRLCKKYAEDSCEQ